MKETPMGTTDCIRNEVAWQANNLAHLLVRLRLRRLGLWVANTVVGALAAPPRP